MIIPPMVTLGFLASLLTIHTENPKIALANGDFISNKPAIYYVAHAIQIVTLLGTGMLSWFALSRPQRRMIALPLAAFLSVSIIFILRGVGLDEMMSTQVVGSTGVVPCLLSLLILFAMREENHKAVDRLIYLSAFGLTTLAGVASVRHPFHTRADAMANLQAYLIALYVPSLWLIFKEPDRLHPIRNSLRFVPITCYAIGSILTQTRLNLILLVPAFGMYLYVQSKRKSILRSLAAVTFAIILVIVAIPLLEHTRVGESLEWSILGLLERLKTDTRSGQIVAYFADMDTVDLLIGRGQNASYMWAGRWWHGGIDVGYLYLVLCGGVPLLVTYVTLHIVPGFRAIWAPMDSRQLTCAAVVVMWALRMVSTGYMDFQPGYYTLLFCVGGCLTLRPQGIGLSVFNGTAVGAFSATRAKSGRLVTPAKTYVPLASERVPLPRNRLLPPSDLFIPPRHRRGLQR